MKMKTKLKTALVQCPAWGRHCPPPALGLLAAALRQRGHEVAVFDFNNAFHEAAPAREKALWGDCGFWEDPRRVARFASAHEARIDAAVTEILDSEARVVGFSIFNSSIETSLRFARKIKERDPGRIVVFGGPQVALNWKGRAALGYADVDAVVSGEGEVTLPEMVEGIERRGRLQPTPGAWTRISGRMVGIKPRPEIADLDQVPFPDYSGFDFARYEFPDKMYTFLTRGCINRCVFCGESLFVERFRHRTGPRVHAEIRHEVSRHPEIGLFEFSDCLINGRLQELMALADLLIEQGPKIRWQAQAIVRPFMTRGVFDKLAASGCREMLFGIESGSQRVIDRMRKGFRVADAENVVRDAAQAGIDVVANFMVGFPGETDADFAATLAFVEKNARWIRYVNPDQTTTGMAPGTYLWEHWDEFGIVEPDGLNWRTRDGRNTIDIRRGRYERFRKRCKALGVQENPRK